jgi:hypothetical protein
MIKKLKFLIFLNWLYWIVSIVPNPTIRNYYLTKIMATITAQILIGKAHPNDNGIQPTHALYLHEGSICSWSLQSVDLNRPLPANEMSQWVCDPNEMLSDALVLIGLYFSNDEKFIYRSLELIPYIKTKRFDSFSIPRNDREELLRMLKQTPMPKMIISIFNDSSLRGNTGLLNEYEFDCEICESTFSRHQSAW